MAGAKERPTPADDAKIRVLFTQSHPDLSPAAAVQRLMMREFDPQLVEAHFACDAATASGLSDLPNVVIRPTNFGPTIYRRSRAEIVRSLARDAPSAAASLAGLIAYARRRRINVVHFAERPRDAVYGVLLGRLVGAKTVFHLHVDP